MRWCACFVLSGLVLALGGCRSGERSSGETRDAGADAGMTMDTEMGTGPGTMEMSDTEPSMDDDERMRMPPQPPGSPCNCDDECMGDETNPGVCVFGVCMQRASSTCSAAGSRAECPEGSRCWGLKDTDASLCFPDCDAIDGCAGICDDGGSCLPTEDNGCMRSCGSLCGPGECSADNPMGVCSADDQVCLEGECVLACSADHPDGFCPEGSECEGGSCVSTTGCPTWMCTGPSCGDIVRLPGSTDPYSIEAETDGYYIATEPRYAYIRRDLSKLIQYAACEVAARYPGTDPIGISDLTEEDGETPGTDRGSPRHPRGTHTGSDMDLAYYQTDGLNNPQIICGDGSDRNANGRPGKYNDGYFCTTEDNIVDWPRQAYWFAKLSSTPLVRVFGIDVTLPDDFREHLDRLLEDGAITTGEHERALRLGYGRDGGWQFHHHHTHMSYYAP